MMGVSQYGLQLNIFLSPFFSPIVMQTTPPIDGVMLTILDAVERRVFAVQAEQSRLLSVNRICLLITDRLASRGDAIDLVVYESRAQKKNSIQTSKSSKQPYKAS